MTVLLDGLEIVAGQGDPDAELRAAAAARLGIAEDDITGLAIARKSLDARKKRRIVYRYRLQLDLRDEERHLRQQQSMLTSYQPVAIPHPLQNVSVPQVPARRPVIVGSGPAGTFAALVLAYAGIPCTVIERGEAVEQRMRTVHRLRRNGTFDPESHYCFGEGGAGTFSDGKLTCGRNHPLIRWIFQEWVRFGAPASIMYDAHPHIGTDYLMQVARRTRLWLAEQGTEFLFSQRLDQIESTGRASGAGRYRRYLSHHEPIETDHVIMALGHSARDTYRMLHDFGLAMAPKPFAMGARIEHPQDEINSIQFGSCSLGHAAEYKLTAQTGERGVWTFCMCPGGYLLPTSAQPGHLAINGMSYHKRTSGFANAAVVVNVRREDFDRGHPLDGVRYQEALEQQVFAAGGGGYNTPAQRLKDFLAGRPSHGEIKSSYKPGVVPARLDQLLPDFVSTGLRQAMASYNQRMRGYISDAAVVAGLESKTSAPIMMTRNRDLQSVSHEGLYPCGEGAGFAGGIVSAALDGVRVGQALVANLGAE